MHVTACGTDARSVDVETLNVYARGLNAYICEHGVRFYWDISPTHATHKNRKIKTYECMNVRMQQQPFMTFHDQCIHGPCLVNITLSGKHEVPSPKLKVGVTWEQWMKYHLASWVNTNEYN